MSDGDLTIDNYTLINCIATGNFTQVWEVAEQGGAQSYAMKLLLPEARKEAGQVRVIKLEAKAGKLFDHPNLMKVHFSVVNKKYGYNIMDFFRAPNLKTQIDNDFTSLHVRIRKLVESTALGLGYMHERRWIHRDVKPDNILFNKGGELRIVDYSLASRAKKKHKEIQGTKSYIAPETLLKKPATAQTDMYSFGITLYLVLTGEFPITGVTPAELMKNHIRVTPFPPSHVNPNVTKEMDEFVLRLLAKKPANRPKTMAEVYADFRNINVFVEDVEELQAREKAADEKTRLFGIDAAARLDSRADAERQELMEKEGQTPDSKKSPPKRAAVPVAKTTAAAKPAAAAAAPPMAPQQPPPNPVTMMPPQPFPPQPAMMPPVMAPQFPPMAQPYQQMPMGAVPLPQFPQGVPPAMPGAPIPQPAPMAPAPLQAPPPLQPPPQVPAAAAQQPVPPAPQPAAPAAPTPPTPVATGDELEFMDELPDVI